jgi:hypothetical protein
LAADAAARAASVDAALIAPPASVAAVRIAPEASDAADLSLACKPERLEPSMRPEENPDQDVAVEEPETEPKKSVPALFPSLAGSGGGFAAAADSISCWT